MIINQPCCVLNFTAQKLLEGITPFVWHIGAQIAMTVAHVLFMCIHMYIFSLSALFHFSWSTEACVFASLNFCSKGTEEFAF